MPRRGGLAIVAVIVATIALATVPSLIHRQALGLGATDIHSVASLPDRISVCGRDWDKDATGRRFTRAEIRSQLGVVPALVDPLPFAPCPRGPCTQKAVNGACDTVVFVRVGEDAYVDYSLSGGP